MSLIIDLTPTEEAQLNETASRSGIAPADLVKKLLRETLRPAPAGSEAAFDAKLRMWQEQDGKMLFPDVPAHTLFVRWAEEDAQMSDDEREVEDRLSQELEDALITNREGLRLRDAS